MTNKQIVSRTIHWMAVIAFLGLFTTEIFNQYFFSKSAILESFSFSFSAVSLQDVPMTDRLFIAKLLRREVWVWHFWFGVSFMSLSILRIAVSFYFKDFRNIVFQSIFALIISIMFITGYPLWARAFENVDQDLQDKVRFIHHYMVYALWVVIFIHVASQIKKQISN